MQIYGYAKPKMKRKILKTKKPKKKKNQLATSSETV